MNEDGPQGSADPPNSYAQPRTRQQTTAHFRGKTTTTNHQSPTTNPLPISQHRQLTTKISHTTNHQPKQPGPKAAPGSIHHMHWVFARHLTQSTLLVTRKKAAQLSRSATCPFFESVLGCLGAYLAFEGFRGFGGFGIYFNGLGGFRASFGKLRLGSEAQVGRNLLDAAHYIPDRPHQGPIPGDGRSSASLGLRIGGVWPTRTMPRTSRNKCC